MKRTLIILLLVIPNVLPAQESFNTTLLGQLAPAGITPSSGFGYSDIWGYYDPITDKEFAIMSHETTFIIDVSDPANPTVASTLGDSWDVKTFSHYVALNFGEIWDISDIYNPVLVTSDGVNGHNIYVDYPYAYKTRNIIDISNPRSPTLMGIFDLHAHDIAALSDTVYYAGYTMQIFNIFKPYSPTLISAFKFTDPNTFAHSAFPTVDRNHLIIADETGSLGVSVWDISDPGNPFQVAQYGPFHDIPTAHNVYVKENYAYISHYVDGLRILDISDPTDPIEAGYYDTYPDTLDWFKGAWGVYPFAPSGNIYVSDRKYGLFVIKFDSSDSLIKISGNVTDKDSGEPIPGAWSYVRGVYKGVSDSLGNYVFHAPKGAHNVITRMFHYLPDTTSVFLSHGSNVVVNALPEYVPPLILFDQQSLNFEAVEIDNRKSNSILMTNLSIASLHLSFTLPDSGGFVIDGDSSLIHPDSSQLLKITFTPSDIYDYSGNLLINSEAGEDTILLRGIGLSYYIEPDGYKSPEIDSVLITAFLPSTSLRVFGLIQPVDSANIDSIELFDDGLHDDYAAGDSIYSNSWPVPAETDVVYNVDLALYSADSNEMEFYGLNRRLFTSIGPIEFDSFVLLRGDSIFNPGEKLILRPIIINSGPSATAYNLTAEFSTIDSCIANIFNRTDPLIEIAAGDRKEIPGFIGIAIEEQCPVDTEIPLSIAFLSNGAPLWEDNTILHISPIAVEDENIGVLPTEYNLSQNHPNPFNPITIIRYSLPVSGDMSLIIYNLLGEEIARLVDGFQPAGEYQTTWNASNVSSGIYFYRLQSGDYTETKKMVLLK